MISKDNTLDDSLSKSNVNRKGSRTNANVMEKRAWVFDNKPVILKDLLDQYKFFRENIYNPERVFYPCCELDVSPIDGFPESKVTSASAFPFKSYS